MTTPDVFLGGTCSASTWRQDLAIPRLDQEGITYYNPQHPENSYHTIPGAMNTEDIMKFQCPQILIVIGRDSRGTATVTETAELICCRLVVYVVLKMMDEKNTVINGERLSERDVRDANRQRETLIKIRDRRRPELPFYSSIEDALDALVFDWARHDIRG
jgi:raw